ncbi:hypothetical protein GCM10023190_15140 [Enteractinococcus fodinae]
MTSDTFDRKRHIEHNTGDIPVFFRCNLPANGTHRCARMHVAISADFRAMYTVDQFAPTAYSMLHTRPVEGVYNTCD